ncbi:MAG: class II fructose-bisphosphate aldolase [Spirochaetaceae bacterium]|nr:class II fructose-bisphosphate aldolase [Spirochaetaceae bacterium]
MSNTAKIIETAYELHIVVPAFNIPYLPMMRPVTQAIIDTGAFALIQVARLEWEKFEAQSLEAVAGEYKKYKDERFMRLHLDHVPAKDEDGQIVDYLPIIRRAIAAGFQSVMIDGSRLDLEGNKNATRSVIELAHAAGLPVEAELGAVLGHEPGPLPPYEELFKSEKGFTDPDMAADFVASTGVDWLSVSIGNIHGAITAAARGKEKPQARLSLERLSRIAKKTGIPLVLHGGTGIRPDNILAGVQRGIAKINIGTAIRAPYEATRQQGEKAACDAVYEATVREIRTLQIEGSAARLSIGAQNA